MSVSYVLNTANQLLVVGTTISISWTCARLAFKKTALHAFLCTLGFLLLLVEALCIEYNSNVLTLHMSVNKRSQLNFYLQLIGGALGVIGSIQKYLGKERHFHSIHGKAGLAVCIFFCLNLASELLLRYQYFEHAVLQHWNGYVKSVLEIVILVLAIVTQYYGYKTGFFERNYTHISIYKFTTLMIFFITILAPMKMVVRKIIQLNV